MSLPQNDNHRHLINAPPTAIRVMNTGRSTKGGRSVPSLPRRRRIRSEDEDYSTDEGSSSSRTSESTEEDTEEESRNSTTKDVDGATAMRLAGMGNSRTLKEVQCAMVKKIVSKNTLLYCPFVNNARELAYNRPFAKITMGFLGRKKMSNEAKHAFWEEYKHTAHKALNVKRSNISGQLRKVFVGKSVLVGFMHVFDALSMLINQCCA